MADQSAAALARTPRAMLRELYMVLTKRALEGLRVHVQLVPLAAGLPGAVTADD